MEERTERMEQRTEERFKGMRDERNYENGVYYRSLVQLWSHSSCTFDGAAEEWENFRREDKGALAYYKDPGARRNDEVRYFKDKFPQNQLFPGGDQSMAHLIPNDSSCSLAWLRALSIVTGIGVRGDCPLLDEGLRSFVEGEASKPLVPNGENVPLKAWNWNFLMLPEDHEKHFDRVARNNNEQIMIAAPIWDQTKEWTPSTGYKLMVAASPKTYRWLLGSEMLTEDSVQHHWLGIASPGEPEKATEFLALTVKALAGLLFNHGEGDLKKYADAHLNAKKNEKNMEKGNRESELVETRLELVFKDIEGAIPSDLLSQRSFHTNDSASASEKSKQPCYKKKAQAFAGKVKAVCNVRDNTLSSNGGNKVQIPVLKNGEKPILVIDLGKYFEGKEYLIPDPYLVVLKAAVTWSSFRDQKLLPACGNHSDHQSGSDARKEELPVEIFSTAGEDYASGDDDSVYSLSEVLTGPPGDWNFEAMPTISPSSKTAVRSAVVTP